MNVTEEILTVILYNDADFSIEEGLAAFHAYGWNHRPYKGLNNYHMNYLYARGLATLNPRKPKNRYRLYVLKERLSQVLSERNGIFHGMNEKIISKVDRVISRMNQGERVTYAEFRNSINDLAVAVANYRYFNSPPRRGSRASQEVSA